MSSYLNKVQLIVLTIIVVYIITETVIVIEEYNDKLSSKALKYMTIFRVIAGILISFTLIHLIYKSYIRCKQDEVQTT